MDMKWEISTPWVLSWRYLIYSTYILLLLSKNKETISVVWFTLLLFCLNINLKSEGIFLAYLTASCVWRKDSLFLTCMYVRVVFHLSGAFSWYLLVVGSMILSGVTICQEMSPWPHQFIVFPTHPELFLQQNLTFSQMLDVCGRLLMSF